MRALIKEPTGVAIVRRPEHTEVGPTEVLVRLAYAGICRTDLYVAEGRLPVRSPRIVLGHEAAGTVVGRGSSASLALDASVVVLPLACDVCARPLTCDHAERLGVDRDGVFADLVSIPESSVRPLPLGFGSSVDAPPLKLAAYVEPVAAALAVRAKIPHDASVVIYGRGRIAELTRRIAERTARDVMVLEPSSPPPSRTFDVAIETTATNETLRTLLPLIRRGGTLVLKSRPFEPVPLDVRLAVERELTLTAVRYAPFEEAIEELGSGRLRVEDLLGQDHALESFEEAFRAARAEEDKPFFRMDG